MNEETKIALEDCFVDSENTDARKFIFGLIKNACQDAKRCERNKVTPINKRQENGQLKQEEHKLKGINLEDYTLDENPGWLPKNMDKEDNTPIELKLGDKTMKFLKIFGQLVIIRHEQFNTAEDEYLKEQKIEMADRIADPKQLEKWIKSQEDARKDRLEQTPNCLEQAIFTSIWPQVQQKVDAADGKVFDDEFEEMYKEKKAKEKDDKEPKTESK